MEAQINNEPLLFPTFLENRSVYNLAEAYWRRVFRQLFQPQGTAFQSFYNQANKDFSGNPIIVAYFPKQHKLVRIIQVVPGPDDLRFDAWIDTLEVKELEPNQRPTPTLPELALMPVPELVIHLGMTKTTVHLTIRLLRQWIMEDVSAQTMKGSIDQILG